MAEQTADIRIVLRDEDRHALLASVTHDGSDLYSSVREGPYKEILRATYHESGKSHTHVADKATRVEDGQSVPLQDFRGYAGSGV